MSILIEGMEMPPDGRYTVCVTHDSHGVVHWVFQNQDTLEFLKHGAVTEVTETHGRLGDLDKLNEEVCLLIKENMLSHDDARDLLETIADAPTVIQAIEEGM